MKKFLAYICILCSGLVAFSQQLVYSEDIVQAKMDSANYAAAIAYIDNLAKTDIDSALNLYPKKVFCYYFLGKNNEAKECLRVIEEEGLENDKTELLFAFYLSESKNKEDMIDKLLLLFNKGEDVFFNLLPTLSKKDLIKLAEAVDKYIFNLEEEDALEFNHIAALIYHQAEDKVNTYNKLSAFIDKKPTAFTSNLMGLIKCEQREFLSAVSYFNQAEDLGYNTADLFKDRAKAKGYEKDFFGAIEDLNIAIDMDKNKSEYYFLRGVCLNFVRQYYDALFDLNTAIKMCDTIAEYYNQRGIVYTNLDKPTDALFEFSMAMKLNSKSEFIHNNIGLAYESNGMMDKAIEHYKISIKKYPYYSDSYFNLGRISYENKRYKEAIKYLDEAFILNPGFGDIAHILGLCYVQLGNIEKACSYFQIAIDTGCRSAVDTQIEFCRKQNNNE